MGLTSKPTGYVGEADVDSRVCGLVLGYTSRVRVEGKRREFGPKGDKSDERSCQLPADIADHSFTQSTTLGSGFRVQGAYFTGRWSVSRGSGRLESMF